MEIGNNLEQKGKAKIDLINLIETRLLITANSGGGKSYCIRKIVEESHGKVQQIIIDLEGEFSTLREKFDFILIGKDGEIPASIKTSELLAKKLLELNTSAIIDLSELRQPERITYVKRFLDSMIDAPKNLWHPVMVIVDEAHHFCPESSKSESASSVIDLMTRGRKRGFAGILATQRISKLNKDAIAEANNYMIGRTGLDIDMKRASEILGFTSKEQTRSLRELDAGEFFAFGPSISKGITKIKIGIVKTKHLKSGGNQLIDVTPPSDKIKKILQKVTDLPKEAEVELKTKEELQREVSRLRRELTLSLKGANKEKIVNVVDNKAMRELIIKHNAQLKEIDNKYKSLEKDTLKDKQFMENIVKQITSYVLSHSRQLGLNIKYEDSKLQISHFDKQKQAVPVIQVMPRPSVTSISNIDVKPLREGAMKMLGWLACFYPESLTREKVATLSGFTASGGTFNTYLSELKRNGWISENGEISITEEGLSHAINIPEKPSNPEAFIEMWASKFREGAARIFRLVCETYPDSMTKKEIGEATGFEPTGGTFNTYISELRRNGLVVIKDNEITASRELFE